MYNEEFLNKLSRLITSLKNAQRAELIVDGNNIIKELYVDPLPNNAILNQVTADETVFIIGRKGTGKSTIFARAQEAFRESKYEISAYIDVKSLYGRLADEIDEVTQNSVTKELLLYQCFIKNVQKSIIDELEKSLYKKHFIHKMFKQGKYDSCKEELKGISERVESTKFIDISLVRTNSVSDTRSTEDEIETVEEISGSIKISEVSMGVNGKSGDREKKQVETKKNYSEILVRDFKINTYMEEIKSTLLKIGIRKIHILLDDFSELSLETQKIFVDLILAPLNNWSDKFFRFKVAAYPNRIYYGDIDIGKVSVIYLDYYNLYKVKDLVELENKATDYLRRLLEQRFEYFMQCSPQIIFSIDKNNTYESYCELLFQVSMNVPRVLGHILNYCYQSAILYKKKINKSLLEEAAEKYYINNMRYYFDKSTCLAQAYDEKLDKAAQEMLFDNILGKSKGLKKALAEETTDMFIDIKGKIPTSHFFVSRKYDYIFSSLELNYFITKCYEQADKDGAPVSIYAINYGACKSSNILFGRPKGETKYNKYYVYRKFEYNELIEQFLDNQVEYICTNCETVYSPKDLDILEKIEMLCYNGCKEVGHIKKCFKNIQLKPNRVADKDLLLEIERDILNIIYENKTRDMYPKIIGCEMDCKYQLVSKKSILLLEKGLITKEQKDIDGIKTVYKLTPKAEELYF